ncbi:MAG: TetR/AcrR family transcriptional regulator [Thermodesulfobacteriota bacterium]|nr:TetR/AcrR family transcriptional regulator [Thermodesulfobacteriota bacterium]
MNGRVEKKVAIKSTNKRRKILNAAEKEFALHGFSGARMMTIAKAAGLDKATIYHYFRAKQDLYDAVLAEVIRSFTTLASKGFDHDTDPRDELDAFIGVLIDFLNKHKSFALILRREFSGPGRARYGLLLEVLEPLILEVREHVKYMARKHKMHEVDPEHTIYSIYEILFSYFTMNPEMAALFFEEKPYTKDMLKRRKEHITWIIRRLLVPEEKMRVSE